MEDLRFAVEEWTCDNSRPLEVIARVGDLAVAMSAFWPAGSGTTEGEDRASSQGAGVGAAGPNPVFPMSFSIETIIADERDLLPRMRALTVVGDVVATWCRPARRFGFARPRGRARLQDKP